MSIIQLKHHMCDYTCMWNGIEDVFRERCQGDVPEWFLFCLSGLGENVYLKHKDESLPRQLCVGDGRPGKIYGKIADIIGMRYKITGGVTPSYAMRAIKKQIDQNRPVVLGPLDMYHLPYLKMYHRFHIPIHYVLMVGYDDEMSCCYVYDCGREALQTLPYEDLLKAWDIEKSSVGDKNGFIRFEFEKDIRGIDEIADICMKRKAESQLESGVSFVGTNALRKAADEFSGWERELTKEGYRNSLKNILMFLATVPKLPNKLEGIDEPDDKTILYRGHCDTMGRILLELGENFNCMEWIRSGKLFSRCGESFEKIAAILYFYLLNEEDNRHEIPELLRNIADLEEQAYRLCLEAGI